jgi:hypothetical protein
MFGIDFSPELGEAKTARNIFARTAAKNSIFLSLRVDLKKAIQKTQEKEKELQFLLLFLPLFLPTKKGSYRLWCTELLRSRSW